MLLPKYPIYIISKGRSESRHTSKTLEELNVPYRIVIEDSEYDDYNRYISDDKILVLPTDFRNNPKWAIPDIKGRVGGSIPVRNWVWDHSVAEGAERHWIMDDNMRYFYRLNRNKKRPVTTPTIIRNAEDFVDRYTNVSQAGLNYAFFCPSGLKRPPYYVNTRVYSCILNSNKVDLRWRGKYNEDTDLSLRYLKDGHCTMLFNFALCGKAATHTMSGGNTQEVYQAHERNEYGELKSDDNRKEFAESLQEQHPDVVVVTKKWGRFHHHVDYTKFLQQPIKKEGLNIPKKINNHGMKLVSLKEDEIKKYFKYKTRGIE